MSICLYHLFQGVQIAIVQGGVRDCGDVEYPGIFVRLDDPSVWNFIRTPLCTSEGERMYKSIFYECVMLGKIYV